MPSFIFVEIGVFTLPKKFTSPKWVFVPPLSPPASPIGCHTHMALVILSPGDTQDGGQQPDGGERQRQLVQEVEEPRAERGVHRRDEAPGQNALLRREPERCSASRPIYRGRVI